MCPSFLRRGLLLVFALAALSCACGPRRSPLLQPLLERERKTPVVLIPGVTGSMLREGETGKVRWGNARGFFFPHDGGYGLARPIPADTPDDLETFAPILQVTLLGIWKVDIYAALQRLMEANGYRPGNLDDPRPDDTFFFFPYDWRYSNGDAVRELARKLENLRRVRGEDTLHVDFVCQSNAARIARFFVKYGGASLEQAEAGTAHRPADVAVDKLILLGTANGGGLRTLRDMNRGRKYVGMIGRKLQPETIFTMWSPYEALPLYREDWFYDGAGESVDADLTDAADWRRFGWSIYGREAAARLHKAGRTDLFGDEAQREDYLAAALDRAVRLHRLLVDDVADPGATRYYAIQSRSQPTLARALLEEKKGRWRTRFEGAGPAAREPGDGHATLASQAWLAPQERAALAHDTVYVDAEHRKIVLSREAQRWILEFLLD